MKIIKDIVFPSEKTKLLMSEILKKYELYETEDEMMKKINAGEKSTVATFGYILSKIATEKMSVTEAREKLKNDLMLSPETAQQLVNELNDKVVPLGKERAIFQKEQKEIEKAEVQKEPLPQIPQKEKIINPYREPIE